MSPALSSLIHPVLGAFARLYPWPVDSGEDLTQALRFLGWDLCPERLVRAGYGAGLLAGGLLAVAVVLVPSSVRPVVALVALATALGVTHAAHSTPQLWATARRTSALGAAPDLVARAVLSMRLSPTPERAAAFTARSGEGLLVDDLRRHIQQAQPTADAGLVAFGDAWADQFPSLRRSLALVTAAGSTPAHDRGRLLDRALTVVLDGTSDQMQAFAAQIRTPATALYAFGILLPIALIALLPAAGVVGVVVTPATVVFVYNLCLPVVLLTASAWLLARRPIAFPPPDVTASHPQVADRTRLAIAAGLVTGAGCAVASTVVFPWWGPPVAGVGIGCGVALWVRYQPVVSVYDRLSQIETGLPDALVLVGRRVANGQAVETALAHAADELDDATGAMLGAGVTRQRQLQVGVRAAFLGDRGTLRLVPSRRVRGSMALLALAGTEGRPAGSALLALGEHLEDLQRIESDARHSLDHVCQTLRSTGVLFGPLVAGSTVALADGMGASDLLEGAVSLTWLGAPVGLYVLCLAVLLTALSTGLTRGVDRALVGYRAGQALVVATVTYLASYLVVGGLV